MNSYRLEHMKPVNISTLRAKLRSILDAVRRGATVEIRDRNVPIARLIPVAPVTKGRRRDLPPWIEKLAGAGIVTVGSLKRVPEIMKKRPVGPPAGVLEALLEDRRSGDDDDPRIASHSPPRAILSNSAAIVAGWVFGS
jgi:prevent-host-death family protein